MTRTLEYAAFPTLGEALRFVVAALDLRARGPKDALKRMDRMAREGDFDAQLFDMLVDVLIKAPLAEQDDAEFGHFMADFVRRHRLRYAKMLGRVCADALARSQLMPLLIEGYFPRVLADFLIEARIEGYIPPPDLLLGQPLGVNGQPTRVSPLRALLEEHLWQRGQDPSQVLAFLQRGNSAEASRNRDKARGWFAGDHTPDIDQLVLAASEMTATSGSRPSHGRHSGTLIRGLRVARAFEYCMAEVGDGQDLAVSVRRLLPVDAEVFDLGTAVHHAVVEQAQRWEGLSELGLGTSARLRFDVALRPGDIEEAQKLLPLFEERAASVGAPWATEWMVRWCRARIAIWQRRWDDGLTLYDAALRASLYRAGAGSRLLMTEALAVAATMKKKAALNRYVEQANALGLWPPILKSVDVTSYDDRFIAHILKRSAVPHLPDYERDVGTWKATGR